MAEKDEVLTTEAVQDDVQPETQPQSAEQNVEIKEKSTNPKVAALKEWFRKKIVALKRKPQTIPFVILIITSIYFLIALYDVSKAINQFADQVVTGSSPARLYLTAGGICIFITTLLSLLVLVSFLNAFPKRKKPNIVFIVMVFVMIAAMIACDLVYYIQTNAFLTSKLDKPSGQRYKIVAGAQTEVIVHVVLLGISAVMLALYPVWKKLINKINTSVKLESATENMKGAIDIQEA